ncbi:long-chain fatty acid--CoA ligase [Mesorhizobium microcysteis]|uniref:Long-chain fatty acid--CoA ligase n=1 Tax=Neoaquamicrobium microcysteis TaxID=2682781 RepID=A0A5D4GZE6_9HYPH|nr:AMP-dependent synthetase/ligase [Mesorhizobium microcysteis]TYR33422.1 long-chain fatty acid--CoA ligase [Mesorhizobium microcysteis]
MTATTPATKQTDFDDLSWKETPPFIRNFSDLFLARAHKSGDRPALFEKRLGLWEQVTWRSYAERAATIGHALMALGLAKGDVVSVLAQNCVDWVAVDMGTLGMGGVCSGIYTTDAPAQAEYLLRDSRTRVVFVEDEEQLDKVLLGRERCPDLIRIVVLDMKGLSHFSDPAVMGMEALLDLGRSHAAAHPGAWHEAAARQSPDDPAIIVYTSGTTGPAKGALVTHRSLTFICYSVRQCFDRPEGDALLSFLPLCHMAERIVGSYLSIMCGNVVYFAESMETVPENLREVQPHFVLAVPRIWEKLSSQVTVALKDGVPLQRWLHATVLAAGQRRVLAAEGGRQPAFADRLVFAVGERLILRNLKRMMGLSRAHSLLTGAAPISPDLIRWFRALGLRMQEAYGQTESTCFLTVTPKEYPRPGVVGKAIPGCEVRLSEEGEIVARGDNVFLEYLNKRDKTEEAKAGGWLHTGDVGRFDEHGMLKIVDRLKDIIITAGGKNITPSEIENQLKFSAYITDAVVIGDAKPYLTCLIMIDHENVAKFAQEKNVPFSNFASLTRASEIVKLIGEEVERVNALFARVEQIKQFRIIDRVLTPEDEEITPTMKLKRKFVHQKFATLIEEMYR